MIELKNEAEIKLMRSAGKVLSKIAQQVKSAIKPGITTQDVDNLAEELFHKEKVASAFKGYRGFPGNICISINDEVVHGIPGERRIMPEDVVSVDLGIKKEGFFSDMAFTINCAQASTNTKKLIETAKRALDLAIRQANIGNHLMDISYAIQSCAESKGFSVVRDFVGHGIGRHLHEDPEIPNFGRAHTGPLLKEGMVLAIETMVNMGSWEVIIKDNGWTAVTKDKLPSAHFEHTVAVTQNGPEILTQ